MSLTVEVVNNQIVKAGDLIARIDDGDYRLALASAQGKLVTQESTSRASGARSTPAAVGVDQAEARLDAAQADAEHAAAEFERQEQLAKADFASKSRLDEATADRDRRRPPLRSAEAELDGRAGQCRRAAGTAGGGQRVAGELRTVVAMAERDLSFTEVRAPVDGVVGNKAVAGRHLRAARHPARGPGAAGQRACRRQLQGDAAGRLRPGQTVRLEVDAFPGHEIEGTVESVAPASGSVFSLLPPENATGNFTKIVQRVPVRIAVAPDVLSWACCAPACRWS